MTDGRITTKVHEHSGTIVIDRPARHNAMTRRLIGELQEALIDLHGEKRVRAVMITGSGKSFCAGTDLEEIQHTSNTEDALQQWHADAVQIRELLLDILRFPKPVIAVVNGPALGAGAALALAADIMLGCEGTQLGMPEARRGLVAGLVAPLLVFRAGSAIAARHCLTSEPIVAEQAVAWGLMQEIVPEDLLWARGHEIARSCARCAPEALALTKRTLNETIGENLATWMSLGAAATATARTTQAASEGIAAFLEKREPEWQ